MSTKKVEFLADRRPARKGSDKMLRALRHLDAARAKLDVLMAIRRELKTELRKTREERNEALVRIDELERLNRQQENEIEAMQVLLDEQSAELEKRQPVKRRFRFGDHDEDGPALTVLAVEKVKMRIATDTDGEDRDSADENAADPAPKPAGLLSRFWRRRESGADETA